VLDGPPRTRQSVTGALATVTYVLNVLAPSVDELSPLRPVSPFRWYLEPDPLVGGLSASNVGVLLAITVGAYAIAWFTLERRDLRA
jgi:hypothetical protein